MAIQSFGDPITRDFFEQGSLPSKGCGWKSVRNVAARKLDMLEAAATLNDLRSPPGNRLHPLGGDLQGSYSIRVNDQWRVTFRWGADGPEEVTIVDYHH